MKHLFSMLISSLMLLSSCSDVIVEKPVPQTGNIIIALSSENGDAVTRSSSKLPDVGGFEVEIYDVDGWRRYRDLYANSEGRTISLNAGTHRLLAQYGDSTGVGFDSIYYLADKQFEVEGQKISQVSATARLHKVKVSVAFEEGITSVYDDWYAKVMTSDGRFLQFSKDETRSGYFPAGTLTVEVYVKAGEQWKFYRMDPAGFNPSEHARFYINTVSAQGTMTVKLLIDNTVDTLEKVIKVPQAAAPQAAPVITMKGFDSSLIKLYGGDAFSPSFKADIVAMDHIDKCSISMKSSFEGVPEIVDLVNPDEASARKLADMGISWLRDMKDKRLSYIDFNGFGKWLSQNFVYEPDIQKFLELKLSVTDKDGREVDSDTYRFEGGKADSDFYIQETDFWTRHINIPAVTAKEGNPERFFVQYKKEGDPDYTTIAPVSVTDKKISYSLSGLEPQTRYSVRSIYDMNENLVSQEYTFTTEAELQVGNAGFEEWTDNVYRYSYVGGSSSINWSTPWTSGGEKWWAVNSMKTLNVGRPTAWYQTYKVFPTAGFTSTESASGKSAQVASIAVDGWAVPGKSGYATTAGELWIGTADANGNHSSDGHTFTSRPSKISYWVLNRPVGGESTRVLVEVRSADGTVLGKAEKVDNKVDRSGRREVLDILYVDKTKKASSIFISIKSSTAGSPTYVNTKIEFAGKTYDVHAGSKINVDDIRLIY